MKMKRHEIDHLYLCAEGKRGPVSKERMAELRTMLAEHRSANGGHERRFSSMTVEAVENGPKRSVMRFTTKPETMSPDGGDPGEAVRLLREDLENEGA